MREFFKPTLAKIIITLLLPTFYVIVGEIFCMCAVDLPCDCPEPFSYLPTPLPLAIFFYMKFGRHFEGINMLYSILAGLVAAYLIACSIVFLVKKLRKTT